MKTIIRPTVVDTIHSVSWDHDEIVFIFGHKATIVYGDCAYRVVRERFPNGMRKTLPMFAFCRKVVYINGKWTPTNEGFKVNWSRQITVIQKFTDRQSK